MTLRYNALLLLIGIVICVAGLLLLPTARQLISASVPAPALCVPERPHDVLISCESRNGSGVAVYGPMDAPTFGLFVGCSPNDDFAYDIPSTIKEMYETKRQPEVAFELSDLGEVKNAVLSRSSGSSSLDLAALEAVSSRQYAPTKCGTCRVVARVAVQLRNPDTGHIPLCNQ